MIIRMLKAIDFLPCNEPSDLMLIAYSKQHGSSVDRPAMIALNNQLKIVIALIWDHWESIRNNDNNAA